MMAGIVRTAATSDVAEMVTLSEMKRSEAARHQPVFWRKAADSAAKQHPFFVKQLEAERTIAQIYEREGVILGFVIGQVVPAPPVYDPGGLTCLIDDFCVRTPDLWATVGDALLAAVRAAAAERGAVQVVLVCGAYDASKKAMITANGCTIASEWYVGRTGRKRCQEPYSAQNEIGS